jgi:2-polyprenyl-3-methyl-5-hydroxy-6-metoxy-1,4-benzoquinol methylase
MDRKHCLLCEGLDFQVIEDCGEGYSVLKCRNCGFAFVDPVPRHENIQDIYSRDYYEPWIVEQRGRRIRMWRKRLKTLNSLSKKKGRLLDIGCGEGLFLEIAKRDGWDVIGTELSSFAVNHIREKHGIQVFKGEIVDIGLPDKSFDAVTMWHVLEHTTDPIMTLKEIKRVIKEDGIFILAVPNLNNYPSKWVYRIVKGRRMHLFSPEDRELHLYHFTPKTIELALEKTGFGVERIIPDMGIIQWPIRIINYIEYLVSPLTGMIVTDAIEILARPCDKYS